MPTRAGERSATMKMADLVRVSATSRSSIHFYRNLGLLPPPVRRGPKLHLYGEVHLRRLREIASLRREGMPIEEIQRRFARREADRRDARKTKLERREPSEKAESEKAESEKAESEKDAEATSSTSELREVIATAAARAFVERGYDAVHVEEIARAAGIGKAKFYRLFPSKADLFVDCLERLRLAVFSAEQRTSLTANLSFEEEARVRAAAVLFRFGPYRMMTNLLAQVAYGPDEDLAKRARTAMHRMVTGTEPMLANAIARGSCRPMNTELVAYMSWGALIALGDRLAFDDRFTPEAALEAYLDFVAHGTTPLA